MPNKDEQRAIIVADLGGSFLRMALLANDGPGEVEVIEVAQCPSFDDALDHFSMKTGLEYEGAGMLLSFGRKLSPREKHVFDHKDNDWAFIPNGIKNKYGFEFFRVVHDARAMGLATLSDRPDVFDDIEGPESRDAVSRPGKKLIILAGTGVGHAFIDTKSREISDSHGAHFPPAFASAEQAEILLSIQSYLHATDSLRMNKQKVRTFIFEDILSGDGLHNIYAALCQKRFLDRQFRDTREMIENHEDETVQAAADEYSSFLGLYAHILAVSGHAYEGVYVCGGHIERMDECGLLNWELFHRNFMQNMVRGVHKDLRRAAIYKASAEHTALYGLEVDALHIGQ